MTEHTPTEDAMEEVLYDEEGNLVTKEEAAAQEEELLAAADRYFKMNPGHSFVIEDEPEEEEDDNHIVSIDDEGKVISERKETTKEVETEVIVEKEVMVPQTSFIDQVVIKQALNEMGRDARRSFDAVERVMFQHGQNISNGMTQLDNLTDAYRKDMSYISQLQLKETISLDDIDNDRIRQSVEYRMKEFALNLMDFTRNYKKHKQTLEVLSDDE